MAIFLVRLCFCGAAPPPVFVVELEPKGSGRDREDVEEDFGGGSANVDLEVGGGSFERSDDADVASVDCEVNIAVVFELSSPLSTSLP